MNKSMRARRQAWGLVMAAHLLLLSACSSMIVADSRATAQPTIEQEERAADALRRAGAGEAAKAAQARADQARAESERPRSFLEWLVDVLFTSVFETLVASGPSK